MTASGEDRVRDTMDHLFRQHAGQMVSLLARLFGIDKLDLIEDAVQDAMVTALKKWPYGGLPDNQFAWLTQVAKNRVIDRLRRGRSSVELDEAEGAFQEDESPATHFEGEIAEDQLRMMFACCHPAIPADSQVALTLKTVGGFSVSEIARAYLANEDAIAKMLTRSKKKLRGLAVQMEIPAGSELAERRDAVLRVLYLMFNEGYSASGGELLFRRELCFEAIRLCKVIARHPVVSAPRVHALAALFLFQAARMPTRTGSGGELILLSAQDRRNWDKTMIADGLNHFRRSASGNDLSDYHIEAEVASIHSLAEDFASTDWPRVIECYGLMQARKFSPVVELNRIVAIGHLHGTEAALTELDSLGKHFLMTSFDLFHITKAHFLAEIGDKESALTSFRRALDLIRNEAIRRFVTERITFLGGH